MQLYNRLKSTRARFFSRKKAAPFQYVIKRYAMHKSKTATQTELSEAASISVSYLN